MTDPARLLTESARLLCELNAPLALGSPADVAAVTLRERLRAVTHAAELGADPSRVVGMLHARLSTLTRARLEPLALSPVLKQVSYDLYECSLHAGLISPEGHGVGVIWIRDQQVLLGERQGAHGAGTWCIPGGHVDPTDPSPQAAAAREFTEETGLPVKLDPAVTLAGTYMYSREKQRLYRDDFYLGSADGEPRRMEPRKCAQWRFWPISALPAPLFMSLEEALARGLDLRALACRAARGA